MSTSDEEGILTWNRKFFGFRQPTGRRLLLLPSWSARPASDGVDDSGSCSGLRSGVRVSGLTRGMRPLHPLLHNESVICAIRADEGRRKRERLAKAAQQRRDKRILFLKFEQESPDEVLTVDQEDEDQEEEAEAKVGHVSHRNTRSAIFGKRGSRVQPLLSRPSIVGDCDDEDMEVDSE